MMTSLGTAGAGLAIFLSVFVVPTAAEAQQPATGSDSAKQMAAQCQKQIDPAVAMLGVAACSGFLDGVMSTHRMMVMFYGARPAYCVPEEGISIGRALDAFVSYLRTHPADADASARQAVLLALADAFPCRELPQK